MRRIFTSAIILLCLCHSFSAQAKIWRVNNNPGIAADFTTLQSAHDGAVSGDTLHVEGSPTSYGNLTCTKKLVIIGPGYFLDENANTQALVQTAKVGTFYFNVGSEGSVIMGLDFLSNNINVNASDLVIRRNKFSNISGSIIDYYTGVIVLGTLSNNGNIAVSNILISQNFGVRVNISQPCTGILISNNYLAANGHEGEQSTGYCVTMHANAIALIQNNLFRRGKVVAYNSNLTNNIMYVGSLEGTGNLISNNISNQAQFGTANNNQANVVMSTVFVGAGTGISSDAQWKLKTGSPAIGAGYGSTTQTPIDAGMFGGVTAYVLSGQPPIPAIYFFENQPVGSNTDPIDVNIKVKSVGN